MKIKKRNKEFVFDRKVSRNGNGGYLMVIKIQKENQKKIKNKSTEKSNAVAEKGTKIDNNILHEKLGRNQQQNTWSSKSQGTSKNAKTVQFQKFDRKT